MQCLKSVDSKLIKGEPTWVGRPNQKNPMKVDLEVRDEKVTSVALLVTLKR